MMTFNAVNENLAVATNSIKTVQISREIDADNYDRNTWMLHTPDGQLYEEDLTMVGPFDSFEKAKRYAEANVGVSINWE
jgi:predicted double-glycine peptidase